VVIRGGGLIVGLMAATARSRSAVMNPEAMERILINGSKVAPRCHLEPISSAVSIGTGGPFGSEGPII